MWQMDDAPVRYEAAIAHMQSGVAAIRAGAPERVWLLAHPHIYTAGSSARRQDLIDAHTLPVFEAGRGGQWTYHGPGQRVAYVMLDLYRPHGSVPQRDLHKYVEGLEAWLISALSRFNINGERRAGRVGIWVADRATGTEKKIAAIGVRVSHWVTWHGISLNVHPNLKYFSGIVPCGIRDYGVTSLHDLGVPVTMREADVALQSAWPEIFGN
jgi:lipoyl(octanoyl) transferase